MESLSDMLQTRVFRIPDYQRGYAWGLDQLQDLWDDLEEMERMESGSFRPHYTGSVHLDRYPEAKIPVKDQWCKAARNKYWYVVDGQQRITTLFILLKVLIDSASDSGFGGECKRTLYDKYLCYSASGMRVYKLDYDDSDPNKKYLESVVYDGCEADHRIVESLYTRNLSFAKRFFETRVGEWMQNRELDDLFERVCEGLKFDVQEMDPQFDVQTVFETMNNRGKPLTLLEKLKNRLIYLSVTAKSDCECLSEVLEAKRAAVREKVHAVWGEIYQMLGRADGNVMSEDELIAVHLSLYRQPDSNDSYYTVQKAEKKLFRMFCARPCRYAREGLRSLTGNGADVPEPVCSIEKIERYVDDLRSFYLHWEFVCRPQEDSLAGRILLLDGSRGLKMLLSAIFKETEEGAEERVVILRILEKTVFRNTVPNAHLRWEGSFANDARDIYTRRQNIDKLEHCSVAEKKDEIESSWRKNPVNPKGVADGFAYLFTYVRGNIGFHRWCGLKYLLFEYECKIWREKYSHDNPRLSFPCYRETTIEHVMPREYAKWWCSDATAFLSGVRAEDLNVAQNAMINTLGNLTLLLHGKNSQLQNYAWKEKRQAYEHGCFSEFEISKRETWGKDEVLARGKEMLMFLGQLLDVQFDDADFKRALLYSPEIFDAVCSMPISDIEGFSFRKDDNGKAKA